MNALSETFLDDSSQETTISHSPKSDAGRILGLLPVFVLILIIFVRLIFVLYKSKGKS